MRPTVCITNCRLACTSGTGGRRATKVRSNNVLLDKLTKGLSIFSNEYAVGGSPPAVGEATTIEVESTADLLAGGGSGWPHPQCH